MVPVKTVWQSKKRLLLVLVVNCVLAVTVVLAFNFLRAPESSFAIYLWCFLALTSFVISNISLCKKRVRLWALALLIFVLCGLIALRQPALSGYVVSQVTTTSNAPTLQPGDLVIMRNSGSFQRGSFVAYRVSADRRDRKRILGAPGDQVGVCGFRGVVVNGFRVQLQDGEIKLDGEFSCKSDIQTYELGEDEFFLVGDSKDSLDSRTLGPVKRKDIHYHSVFLIRGGEVISLTPSDAFSKLNN